MKALNIMPARVSIAKPKGWRWLRANEILQPGDRFPSELQGKPIWARTNYPGERADSARSYIRRTSKKTEQ
jgi:hypothetical protein